MAKSVAINTGGTTLGIAPAIGAFTTFAEVVNIRGPGVDTKAINISHLTSPGEWEEFLPGYKDAGEITLDINYNSADDLLIASNLALDDQRFVITFPNGATLTWVGFIKGWGHEFPVNDKLSNTCTIKIDGPLTLTD